LTEGRAHGSFPPPALLRRNMFRAVSQPHPAEYPEPPLLRDPSTLPGPLARPVVAIGNFDGAHRGHAAVIEAGRRMAERFGRPLAALTFEPHPVDYFAGPGAVFRLTPEAARTRALGRFGVDAVIVLTFDDQIARQEPGDFVRDVLVTRLGVTGVVVGYDFHFGRNRQGSPEFLARAGREAGFEVDIVSKVVADAGGAPEAVHSNAARAALEAGNVALAARLLGHEWFVVGAVIHGQKLGRTLGFPTANVALDPSCRLRHGIYAVRLTVEGATYGGVASFGSRPTVTADGAPLLETFVFDFDGDLYGKSVEIAFVEWIRGEEKFGSLDALVAAMKVDQDRARVILRTRDPR
jgi:riboflavin kinase / FMN adenylyltransferase